ncbi:hypothetical protein BST81_03315 [Leptolyngbya sp. 'hensonii']|uniref:hypothetical protein n=1 Tax=Leptolyngbya sp. 'hensonii' TaxID=1922337 RepID=UPI00094F5F6D|nr:hypothetical protein [Leptolyngbya sp. 'hensonii']OLP19870.1 hypothetical protein BST81_03315 [Leptolyngbya sp. 'hensonii']
METLINRQQVMFEAIAAYPQPYRSDLDPTTCWTLKEIYAGKLILCSEPFWGSPQIHPEYAISKEALLDWKNCQERAVCIA